MEAKNHFNAKYLLLLFLYFKSISINQIIVFQKFLKQTMSQKYLLAVRLTLYNNQNVLTSNR